VRAAAVAGPAAAGTSGGGGGGAVGKQASFDIDEMLSWSQANA
jgi:hypothetical protein